MATTVFEEMIGRTFTTVTGAKGGEAMQLLDDAGKGFRFYHSQDCCESVTIDDIVGDLTDLVGSPIVEAVEVSTEGEPKPEYADDSHDSHDSHTWTFYRFATVRGTVTVKWLGTSNGYYSESVDCERVN